MPAHQNTNAHIVAFDLIEPCMIAVSQKQAFGLVAEQLADKIGINARILTAKLTETEKERPSTVGGGVVIKHIMIDGLQSQVAMMVRFKNPVPMQSADNRNVDLMFLLVTPQRQGAFYLQTLSRLSRFLNDIDVLQKLRTAQDIKSLRAVLEGDCIRKLAA